MSTPLDGIKIIDFTHVQAGPACTQLLAWFGADVIKIERPGSGDVTRSQLRDLPDQDALYFTMLNSNKKSLTLDTKTAEGKEVLERLIKESDVLVENFAPGAMDRMGFSWERIQELNPGLILASVKGFSDGHHYEDLKVYENVAQAAGGAASTTGFWDGPPMVSGAALGNSNTGMHLAIGILTALMHREKTGKGQKVSASMQDAVLNLTRVKLRDQQRLDKIGYLEEYPQYPHGKFSDVVPRGGNAGGGGQPGWVLKCKGWEDDPNAYIYFTIQGSTSPSRAMPGIRSAAPSASLSGSTIRPTTRPRHARTKSSTSLPISNRGWPTKPSSRRSTFCASSTFHARRC
jgi:formyl-CoA transferase